jgi:hypothetical protein
MANGGRRAGAGRKRLDPPVKQYHVSLTDEQAKKLRMWGKGDMAAGLRWLIDSAKHLIVRHSEEECHHQVEPSPPHCGQ